MCRCRKKTCGSAAPGRITRRRAFSLAELLIAVAIMAVLAGAMGALAMSVETGNAYSQGHAEAAQHARAVRDHVERLLRESVANEQFPGFLVLSETVGDWKFPDTLVIWHPAANAANPDGLPLMSELVVICPDPVAPNKLVEITARDAALSAPSLADMSLWKSEIDSMKAAADTEKVLLTDLLRTASVQDAYSQTFRRGAARFYLRLRPSQSEWSAYENGFLAWESLSWVQGIYGGRTGLRQSWCSFELQLMPGESPLQPDPNGDTAVPSFGSAARYYEMHR